MEPYYVDSAVTIWNADALTLPIPDSSVDLVVTSPPYFGLRSYTDGGQHYDGQIGSEPTPAEFVDALIAATAEMVRTLKPSGSIFVNLGDKYSGNQAQNFGGSSRAGDSAKVRAQTNPKNTGIPNKSLMGLPWRYALRCIDELGLILRAEVIWAKPNGLPESVTDRVRRSHEQWFHFTKEPRYFSAVDEIREQYAPSTAASYANGKGVARIGAAFECHPSHAGRREQDSMPADYSDNPLGKLPGSVWNVPTQPLKVPAHLTQHFAAFPLEWPRRIIRGWSPAGVCVECSEGRRPVVVSQRTIDGRPVEDLGARRLGGYQSEAAGIGNWRFATDRKHLGYACACEAPTAATRPAVVLDPFGGTGTVALMAKALGRIGWHIDLSRDYCRLAQWRVTDPGELARAMQVEKPPAAPEDMDALFDLDEGVA